jgi:hypothetical protein
MPRLPGDSPHVKSIRCHILVEEYSGKERTYVVFVPKHPGEGALSLRDKAYAAYRLKHGYNSRVVSFEINVGSERGAA